MAGWLQFTQRYIASLVDQRAKCKLQCNIMLSLHSFILCFLVDQCAMCKMIYAMGNMQFPMQCDTMCNVWTTILLLWLISMQWELCLGQSAMHCNTMHNVWSAILLPWTISHLTVTRANCYTRSFSYKKAAINTISFSHQKWAIKTMSHVFFLHFLCIPPSPLQENSEMGLKHIFDNMQTEMQFRIYRKGLNPLSLYNRIIDHLNRVRFTVQKLYFLYNLSSSCNKVI